LTVTARELLDSMGERLVLRLVAGARGVDRAVAVPRVQQPGLALAGFLPQLHPDRIQVLGNSEIAYLQTLDPDGARRAVRGVAQARVACFVVTNDAPPPSELVDEAERADVPLIACRLATGTFIPLVTRWLEERLAASTSLHATFVEVGGLGVLITGRSGIGKSEVALDLVTRGHRFVADDVVIVRRLDPSVLRGRAGELQTHHMEIRGLGIIDVEAMYGRLATLDEHEIDLVVELIDWTDDVDRLGITEAVHELLGVSLPLVRIPVTAGRSLGLLIETAVREQMLRRRGHHAAVAFVERVDRAARGDGRGET
jgi:HPr kinase/phosphorylase